MNWRRIVGLVMLAGLCGGATWADELAQQLDQAGAANGADYIRWRDQIVGQGSAVAPQLEALAKQQDIPWQRR